MNFIELCELSPNDLENTEFAENVFLEALICLLLGIHQPPCSFINLVLLILLQYLLLAFYFSDMVINVWQVDYIFNVLSNVLDLSLETVQIGLSSLDNTVVKVMVALMADYKFEHNSSKEVQQLRRRRLHF